MRAINLREGMRHLKRGTALGLLLASLALAGCQTATAPPVVAEASTAPDPMLPTSSTEDALVSPLAAVTIATGDLQATRRFYVDGLGMEETLLTLTAAEAAALGAAWSVSPDALSSVSTFTQPGAPGSAIVRAVKIPATLPPSRPGHDSRPVGPLGFGLPGRDFTEREARVNAAGYRAVIGLTEMDFPRSDGTFYTVGEIHFKAPDDLLVLGVDRDDMQPVGPIDPVDDIGGVAYASVLVDDLEQNEAFLSKVLGLEKRREMTFQSAGPGGGMVGMRAGENVAFEQWFSPGARTGYLVVMELLDGHNKAAAPFDFTTRGVSMWTFTTDDVKEIASRWSEWSGTPIEDVTLRTLNSPGFGSVTSLMIKTPDGVPIEVLQR